MKKSRLLFVLPLVMLLPSCVSIWDLPGIGSLTPGGSSGGAVTIKAATIEEKSLPVYDLKKAASDGLIQLDFYKVADMKVCFPDNRVGVPYVSFDSYAEHVSSLFAPNWKGVVQKQGSSLKWTVSQGETTRYQLIINLSSASVQWAGSLSSADGVQKDYSKTSLSLDGFNSYKVVEQGTGIHTESLAVVKSPFYQSNNVYYYPLGLLNTIIGKELKSHYFYDFDRLYRYEEYDALYADYSLGEANLNPSANVLKHLGTDGVMPEDLRALDADCLYYTFENQYGLLRQRNVVSGKDLLDRNNIREGLLSANTLTRQTALYKAFALFDDDHTGIRYKSGEMWKQTKENYVRGVNSTTRARISAELQGLRDAAFGLDESNRQEELRELRIHEDMAYFSFDSFAISYDAFDAEGKPKADLWQEDTFAYFVHQFDLIKEHGGINKVVIDASLNGGGIVGVLYKLCGFLSKENCSRSSMYNSMTKQTYTVESKADPNHDGTYEVSESVGDDYQLYVLTSTMSFSCGNAFPFLLRKQGFAKIIGENSGGGECTVDSSNLPSGQNTLFSSHNHIGFIPRGDTVFFGDEGGAGIDIALAHDEFYDLAKLYAKLS